MPKTVQEKKCKECGLLKAANEFNLNKELKDGLSTYCIKCNRERASRWQKLNRARATKRQREWILANPEEHRLSRQTYRKHNKSKFNESTRKWAAKNPDNRKANRLLFFLGITLDHYKAMLKEQEGVCKICLLPSSDGKSLSVDHCHITGKVRGLLCTKCNTGIGMLGDKPELLEAALNYLKS